IVFFITLLLCYIADWLKLSYLFGHIDPVIGKKFGAFALMALTTAICVPLSQIFLRSYLTLEFGIDYAGYWVPMAWICGGYLMLVTTTLGVYYLPRLSELSFINDIKKEVYWGYKFIFPLAILSSLCIYLLRDWTIAILFTDSFFPMRDLFLWQIIGNSLQVG